MRQRIVYVHGRFYEKNFYCSWCDMHRTGRVVRELYRWRANLTCGHVVNRGYTLPPPELERKGYINQKFKEDPRFTAKKKALFSGMMKRRDEALHARWVRENLAGGKGVL